MNVFAKNNKFKELQYFGIKLSLLFFAETII